MATNRWLDIPLQYQDMADRAGSLRPIVTEYYEDAAGTKVVYRCFGKWIDNAVRNCMGHMAVNHYGAMSAQVFDAYSGKCYLTCRLYPDGDFRVHFKRKVEDHTLRELDRFKNRPTLKAVK